MPVASSLRRGGGLTIIHTVAGLAPRRLRCVILKRRDITASASPAHTSTTRLLLYLPRAASRPKPPRRRVRLGIKRSELAFRLDIGRSAGGAPGPVMI